jgi:hypothetical protein
MVMGLFAREDRRIEYGVVRVGSKTAEKIFRIAIAHHLWK